MTHSLQESFLKHLMDNRISTTVFLSNGVKLQGRVSWFEDGCIALTRDNVTQVIFRHAVATIMPETPLQVHDIEGFDHAGNC